MEPQAGLAPQAEALLQSARALVSPLPAALVSSANSTLPNDAHEQLRRGMTAWMQAWSQCTDVAPKAHLQAAMTAAVPIDLRMQVATLLAGIILRLHQEATP
jgi:hypothetical protein